MSTAAADNSPPLSPFPSSIPPPSPPLSTPKCIAIVGGGSAGLGALLGLLDLPLAVRRKWQITLHDKREEVGGVWLPDPDPSSRPGLPESPLYPLLKTNTPTPTMTYPNLPFPPSTPLFPLHNHIKSYHSSVVESRKLSPYIRLSSEITNASWNAKSGAWDLEVLSRVDGRRTAETVDHLIVANGHYRYPSEPVWEGLEEWKKGGAEGERVVKHSLYYRGPEEFAGRTVVVVGFGASGWDIARQAVGYATEVYHSFSPREPGAPALPPILETTVKPRISHFTPSSIHFTDGTSLSSSNTTIYLATGYQVLFPFLPSILNSPTPSPTALTTNGTYVHPLHLDIFALGDPNLSTNALAFVGLNFFVAAAAFAYDQGLYIAHALADPSFLPPREKLLLELADQEDKVREDKFDPFEIGHKFYTAGAAEAYQNALLQRLRSQTSVPLPKYLAADPSRDFVEKWRLDWRARGIKLGLTWAKAVAKGIAAEERFTSLVGTEEDWVKAMEALEAWGEEEEAKELAAVAVTQGVGA